MPMLLALRKTAPEGATLWQRFVCWVIKARLASDYCHGGIVIDGHLYHSTSALGLHRLDAGYWTPKNWDLIDIGGDDEAAKRLFTMHIGAGYDWFSLLAFVGLRVRDSERMYCFEWCWLAVTGEPPRVRVTPENLVLLAILHKLNVE
jgi:hypothetical protein